MRPCMNDRAWLSGYTVSVDGGETTTWVPSVRALTEVINASGTDVSMPKVYAILYAGTMWR